MDLTGASAVITGGASGIGEASARNLAGLGARCVIVDLQDEKGEAVAKELGGLYVKADVADEEQVQAAMDAAMEMGPLRALVNGAGIGSASRTVDRNGDPMPLAQFEFVIRVNLIGTFNCIRLGAASMAKTDPLDSDGQRGAIVNMASSCCVRWANRSKRLFSFQRRRCRNDPSDSTRSGAARDQDQYNRSWTHRYTNLRRGRSVRPI